MVKSLSDYNYERLLKAYQQKNKDLYIESDCVYEITGFNDYREEIRLQCIKHGNIRTVMSRRAIHRFIQGLKNKPGTGSKKTPASPLFSSVDRNQARRLADNYEGDLRRDMLQPYNADGSVNKEFVREYGTSAYNS